MPDKAADKVKEAPPLAGAVVGRDSADMRVAAKLFDGFADPTRMSILALLARKGEMSVSELVEEVGASQPRMSVHLRCLAWCGYVRGRREGQRVYYSIADARVLGILRLGEELLADNREHVEACEVTGDC
jgi:DNA-binding transcriptional ArsR family regulator